MSVARPEEPYALERVTGGYRATEPVTGLRAEQRLVGDAIAVLHRMMIDRRAELRERDPATLDEHEQCSLRHLNGISDRFLFGGLQCATPRHDSKTRPQGRRPPRARPLSPYLMERVDGGYAVSEPVTGLRVERRLVGDAIAGMHRCLLERRAELRARDPESLDARERRELDRLDRYSDRFLREGLKAGTAESGTSPVP